MRIETREGQSSALRSIVAVAFVGILALAQDFDDPDGKKNNWKGTGEMDTMNAGAGDDKCEGNAGRDAINGEGDDDKLEGGEDDDNVNGGDGDDRFYFNLGDSESTNAGDENIEGGPGSDKCYFTYNIFQGGHICRLDATTIIVTDPGAGEDKPGGGRIILSGIEEVFHLGPGSEKGHYKKIDLTTLPPCQ